MWMRMCVCVCVFVDYRDYLLLLFYIYFNESLDLMKLLCLYAFLKVERKGEVVYFCQFTSEQDGLFA